MDQQPDEEIWNKEALSHGVWSPAQGQGEGFWVTNPEALWTPSFWVFMI